MYKEKIIFNLYMLGLKMAGLWQYFGLTQKGLFHFVFKKGFNILLFF